MYDLTVGDALKRAVRLYPSKAATWYQDEAQSFAGFQQDVLALCGYLRQAGLQPGDRVAVLSRNNPNLLKVLFAAALGGYVFVPINFRLAAKEVAFLVGDCEPSVLFADSFFMATAEEAVAEVDAFPRERLLELTADFVAGLPRADERSLPEVSPEDLFGIYYTSGTTGNPKGVMLSHRNMMAGVINHTIAYQLGPDDVCLHIMPLYHTMEASLALCQFFVGGGNVIEENFDAERFWGIVDQYQVTHVTGVFTMLAGMLEHAPARGKALGSSLRTVSLGGQSVPVEIIKEGIRVLGEDRLIQVYGLTESAPLITYLPRSEIRLEGDLQRLGSVGLDLCLCETRVVDDAGQEVKPGELGEIVARGPNVMIGYWNRPEETAKTLDGGWLHTGDVGRRDEAGYLYVVDRKKDVIISGGENIAPREIEEVVFAHPQVRECSVFGIPDPRWGETVGVAVTVEGELTEQEVIEFCQRSLGKYKLPRKVWFLSELPKDPVGKIQKRLLRERCTAELEEAAV